jgi:type II secretory pathway predicted ATPase ExeA
MFTQFYGLKEKPFKLVPDPRFLYLSDSHKSAISHLRYGLDERNGFVVITGEVGSGKTLLLRVLMRDLPRTTQVARVINTNFNAKELLEHILNEFGVETEDYTKPKMISLLSQFLLKAFSEEREILLVIDEAQNLSIDALEELRMVSNLETSSDKLIQIVMVGQPQLRSKLNLADLEQLRQRVTVQYHLPALSKSETFGYVRHRLAVARGEPVELFSEAALEKIYDFSGGIPRLINVVSDAGLRLGFVEEKIIVDEYVMDEVIRELQEIEEPVEGKVTMRHETSTPLDQNIVELNKKFQSLYDQMQKIYVHKGEESQLVYERLMNVEKEMLAKESLFNLQERERMIFEKEREIHNKLSEVSNRLDEVNVLKENLEDKKLDVQDKVKEIDYHLTILREQRGLPQGKSETAANIEASERKFKKKLMQLEGVQNKLQTREEELIFKMEALKNFILELENKKVLLDTLGQDKSLEERLVDLENQQKSVRRNEEELLSKIASLEKSIQSNQGRPASAASSREAVENRALSGQDEILLDLISRVDILKSDINSLELQKEVFHSIGKEEKDYQLRKHEIDEGHSSIKNKEGKLLDKINGLKGLFKVVEDKTDSVDALTDTFVKKERILESKLDELKNLILRVEDKELAVKKMGGDFVQTKGEGQGLDFEKDVIVEKTLPGRRFNQLVRKILKKS